MRLTVFCAACVAGTMAIAGTAFAEEPQETRQKLMKQVGGAIGSVSKMAKGQMDFDAAAAIAAFTTMNTVAQDFGNHLPEGSESGFETEASPKIWSDRAGFDAILVELADASAAAIAAAPQDAGSLGPLLGPIGKTCGTCHKGYRVKN